MSAGAISIDKQVSKLEGLQNHGQLIFGTVHQNIDYQLKEPTRVTSLARSLASLGNTLVSKFLLVPIII